MPGRKQLDVINMYLGSVAGIRHEKVKRSVLHTDLFEETTHHHVVLNIYPGAGSSYSMETIRQELRKREVTYNVTLPKSRFKLQKD